MIHLYFNFLFSGSSGLPYVSTQLTTTRNYTKMYYKLMYYIILNKKADAFSNKTLGRVIESFTQPID